MHSIHTIVFATDCGERYISGTHGQLYLYTENRDHIAGRCTWSITVDAGSKVWLVLDYLYGIPDTDGCRSNYIKVYNSSISANDGVLLDTYVTDFSDFL